MLVGLENRRPRRNRAPKLVAIQERTEVAAFLALPEHVAENVAVDAAEEPALPFGAPFLDKDQVDIALQNEHSSLEPFLKK